METLSSHSRVKWVALTASVLGAGVIYLWQPITELFLTGTYDENVIVSVDAESFKDKGSDPLLVVKVRITNRGAVPAWVKDENDKGDLFLVVSPIHGTTGKWIEDEKLEVVAQTSLLNRHKGGYVVAPNSFFEEVEAVPLPKGNYLIKATLKFPDGDYIDQRVVVSHSESQ